MDRYPTQKRASPQLFPAIAPFDQRMIDVGGGHEIYVEQCGNPQGAPVVVFHGGPGGGCSPLMRRYFDPSIWRIVLFDQRGCGRSKPHAVVEGNTTWDLVFDIEHIRGQLGIERWAVFGGSWGATLALIYAITHPERVGYLALRGVFLMMQRELDWFYGGGAGQFWPEQWDRFASLIPSSEQGDLVTAYHARLFCGDYATEVRYGRAWAAWENALASFQFGGHHSDGPADYVRAFSRLENHYFTNKGWLDHDGWILSEVGRIARIPGVVVQGRYDMICPPHSAYRLCQGWSAGRLVMVRDAGHAMSEPGITQCLIEEMMNAGMRTQSLGLR